MVCIFNFLKKLKIPNRFAKRGQMVPAFSIGPARLGPRCGTFKKSIQSILLILSKFRESFSDCIDDLFDLVVSNSLAAW